MMRARMDVCSEPTKRHPNDLRVHVYINVNECVYLLCPPTLFHTHSHTNTHITQLRLVSPLQCRSYETEYQ